jgi:hypothetical protein
MMTTALFALWILPGKVTTAVGPLSGISSSPGHHQSLVDSHNKGVQYRSVRSIYCFRANDLLPAANPHRHRSTGAEKCDTERSSSTTTTGCNIKQWACTKGVRRWVVILFHGKVKATKRTNEQPCLLASLLLAGAAPPLAPPNYTERYSRREPTHLPLLPVFSLLGRQSFAGEALSSSG